MTKIKTRHFTFRIDSDLFYELEQESKKQSLSPMILMRLITNDYIKRGKFLQDLGFVNIDKRLLRVLFENMSIANIDTAAKQMSEFFIKEYLVYFYHKTDADSLLRFLDIFLPTQGNIRTHHSNGVYSYTIHHDIYQKYSKFLEGFLFYTIESIIKSKVRLISSTSQLLSFNFEA